MISEIFYHIESRRTSFAIKIVTDDTNEFILTNQIILLHKIESVLISERSNALDSLSFELDDKGKVKIDSEKRNPNSLAEKRSAYQLGLYVRGASDTKTSLTEYIVFRYIEKRFFLICGNALKYYILSSTTVFLIHV